MNGTTPLTHGRNIVDPATGREEYLVRPAMDYINTKLGEGAKGTGYVLDFGSREANEKFRSQLLHAYDAPINQKYVLVGNNRHLWIGNRLTSAKSKNIRVRFTLALKGMRRFDIQSAMGAQENSSHKGERSLRKRPN